MPMSTKFSKRASHVANEFANDAQKVQSKFNEVSKKAAQNLLSKHRLSALVDETVAVGVKNAEFFAGPELSKKAGAELTALANEGLNQYLTEDVVTGAAVAVTLAATAGAAFYMMGKKSTEETTTQVVNLEPKASRMPTKASGVINISKLQVQDASIQKEMTVRAARVAHDTETSYEGWFAEVDAKACDVILVKAATEGYEVVAEAATEGVPQMSRAEEAVAGAATEHVAQISEVEEDSQADIVDQLLKGVEGVAEQSAQAAEEFAELAEDFAVQGAEKFEQAFDAAADLAEQAFEHGAYHGGLMEDSEADAFEKHNEEIARSEAQRVARQNKAVHAAARNFVGKFAVVMATPNEVESEEVSTENEMRDSAKAVGHVSVVLYNTLAEAEQMVKSKMCLQPNFEKKEQMFIKAGFKAEDLTEEYEGWEGYTSELEDARAGRAMDLKQKAKQIELTKN